MPDVNNINTGSNLNTNNFPKIEKATPTFGGRAVGVPPKGTYPKNGKQKNLFRKGDFFKIRSITNKIKKLCSNTFVKTRSKDLQENNETFVTFKIEFTSPALSREQQVGKDYFTENASSLESYINDIKQKYPVLAAVYNQNKNDIIENKNYENQELKRMHKFLTPLNKELEKIKDNHEPNKYTKEEEAIIKGAVNFLAVLADFRATTLSAVQIICKNNVPDSQDMLEKIEKLIKTENTKLEEVKKSFMTFPHDRRPWDYTKLRLRTHNQ